MSVPPPPYNSTCAAVNTFLHVVHDRVAAGDDHLGAVTELTRQPAELGDGPRELRVLHRAGRVDQKPRPGPRLVKGRHDELAVARPAGDAAAGRCGRSARACCRAAPCAPRGGWSPCSPPSASARCAPIGASRAGRRRRRPSGRGCAARTSRRTSSAFTGSTPGTPPGLPSSSGSSHGRRSPWAPEPQSWHELVLASDPIAGMWSASPD